jgi:hypothetical protein
LFANSQNAVERHNRASFFSASFFASKRKEETAIGQAELLEQSQLAGRDDLED